jgi:uncharacterized protein YbjT (DUF2867 family)
MATHKVLVVGASGNIGSKVVTELRALGASVRATVRKDSKKPPPADAELVEADLADEASLERACAGIDVVVSTVQGMRDVIVEGQTRLLRAAEKAGVKRMIPSDYSLDFFKTKEGGNRNLDLRRELNKTLDGSRVRGTSLLCGAFMELLLGPAGPDAKTGIYKVWGDENQVYDFTYTGDVAKFIAATALDDAAGRVVRVVGDSKSPREIATIFGDLRDAPVRIENLGPIEILDQVIAKMRADDPAETSTFPVWQQLQYVRDMASGVGRLTPLDNARYPGVQPENVRDFAKARLSR